MITYYIKYDINIYISKLVQQHMAIVNIVQIIIGMRGKE